MTAQAHISLDACVANCATLRSKAGSRRLFAVVKANAYGHGMERVADALAGEADGFCVFDASEAMHLRASGCSKPIVVLKGFTDEIESLQLAKIKAWPVVHNVDQLYFLYSGNAHFERVLLKVNTGMNRLGMSPSQAERSVRTIEEASDEIVLMTHYANADVPGGTSDQASIIDHVASVLGFPVTCSNTAATLLAEPPSCGEEFVRCGIGIYGGSPVPGKPASQFGLVPAMSLYAQVLEVRPIAAGQTIGYGSTWTAPSKTKIAILDIGYADGYHRCTTGSTAMLGDKPVSVIGRVAMDMTAVDIGSHECSVGDMVQMWGKDIAVDDVANCCGTIGYELLAGLADRIPRKYD